MIPAEAVEAAAKALRDKYAAEVTELPVSSFLGDATAALEAAAPYLLGESEAEALEDAAAAFPTYGPSRTAPDASTWLTERAALIRKGIHP